eukprot:3657677-Prymnesium_polylepis.1
MKVSFPTHALSHQLLLTNIRLNGEPLPSEEASEQQSEESELEEEEDSDELSRHESPQSPSTDSTPSPPLDGRDSGAVQVREHQSTPISGSSSSVPSVH